MAADAATGLIAALKAKDSFRKEFFAAKTIEDAAALATRSGWDVSLTELEALAGGGPCSRINFEHLEVGPWVEATRLNFVAAGCPVESAQNFRIQGNGLLFLDAHDDTAHDFGVVTRSFQNNTRQHWQLITVCSNIHRLRQISTNRFLDAHEIPERDFRIVTRPFQANTTQWWRVFDFGGNFFTLQQVSSGRFASALNDADKSVVTRPQGGNEQQWRRGDP